MSKKGSLGGGDNNNNNKKGSCTFLKDSKKRTEYVTGAARDPQA